MIHPHCDHCQGIQKGDKHRYPVCGRWLIHHLPTRDEIYRQAAEIRSHWPASRLRQQERYVELETPLAHQVTDHMVRRDGEGEARK